MTLQGTSRYRFHMAGICSCRSCHCDPVRRSHVGIVGPAAAFRRDPDDVLRRILDVAGLAVHAVLGVDLQPLRAVSFFNES